MRDPIQHLSESARPQGLRDLTPQVVSADAHLFAPRPAYRFRAMPHEPYRLIGFRVVCAAEGRAP